MGSRLLIVEIDNVLANVTRRKEMAELYTAEIKRATPGKFDATATFYSKDAFFNPLWLQYDTVIPGTDVELLHLSQVCEFVLVLTGRPHWMHADTVIWLEDHGMWCTNMRVTNKDYSNRDIRYTKTATWKRIYLEKAIEKFLQVIFVDNSPTNLAEARALGASTLYSFADLHAAMHWTEQAKLLLR
jgi:hypothetical protein